MNSMCCIVAVARELLAAGRVQFKNCVLGIVETEANSITNETQVDVDIDTLDTVQVAVLIAMHSAVFHIDYT